MLSLEKALYQIFIWFYGKAIVLASSYSHKAKLWLNGRQVPLNELTDQLDSNRPSIWMHCASLGEFEQGRPLLELIKERHPNLQIVLSFFSPSGYEVRKNYKQADIVCYLPLDTQKNAKEFIDAIQPSLAIFVKYEFWLNHLSELNHREIPTYLISSIFRKDQPFFKWYGKWHKSIVTNYSHIFVQNEASKQLLKNIGMHQVSIASDTRFDRVANIQKEKSTLNNPLVDQFKGKSHLLIAGSTWPEDESKVVKWTNQSLPYNYKVVIAPHQVDSKFIESLEDRFKRPVVRYSRLSKKNATKAQVLLIDNIGMLNEFYKIGRLAYVGGGFGQGIHNILEPAACGLPIVFGPNYKKFNEANELIKIGGAFSIQSYYEFKSILHELIFRKGAIKARGLKCTNYINQNVGGKDMIYSHLQPLLEKL